MIAGEKEVCMLSIEWKMGLGMRTAGVWIVGCEWLG